MSDAAAPTVADSVQNWSIAAACASMGVLAMFRFGDGLSSKGWHGDDAWIVGTIVNSDSLAERVDLGFTHPLYTLWVGLITNADASRFVTFRMTSFVSAVVAVVLMFLIVRRVSNSVVVAWVACVPIVASWLWATMSIAVKPYTFEAAVFAAVLLVLHSLVTVTRPWLIAWGVLLLPAVAFSFRISLISVAVASGLWWARKLSTRDFVGLGVLHAVLLIPYSLYLRTTFNAEAVADWWRDFEGVLDSSVSELPRDLILQFRRATRVVVDGPVWVGWLIAALVVVGALHGLYHRRALESSAAAALGIAVLGSAAGASPFGPERLDGARIDLWLAPAILVLSVVGAKSILEAAGALPAKLAIPKKYQLALMGLALIGGTVAVLRTGDAHTLRRAIPQHDLTYALDQLDARDNALLAFGRASPVHIAALRPDLVDDVRNDPNIPRGYKVELVDGDLIDARKLVSNPDVLAGRDGVVLFLPGLNSIRDDVVDELRAAGFDRWDTDQFRFVEVWTPAEDPS